MQQNLYTASLVAQEEIQEQLRDAEQERLARLATAGQPKKARLYDRILSWISCLLVAWGQRLRTRHARITCATDCRSQPTIGER